MMVWHLDSVTLTTKAHPPVLIHMLTTQNHARGNLFFAWVMILYVLPRESHLLYQRPALHSFPSKFFFFAKSFPSKLLPHLILLEDESYEMAPEAATLLASFRQATNARRHVANKFMSIEFQII